MQIRVAGVKNHGFRRLVKAKLTPTSVNTLGQLCERARVDLQDDGSIQIQCAAKHVKMNGNYWFDVELTKQEVALLAKTTFAEVSIAELLSLLTES